MPACLSRLLHLSSLQLGRNMLEEVPAWISRLTALTGKAKGGRGLWGWEQADGTDRYGQGGEGGAEGGGAG